MTQANLRYKACIFDLDGTLLDTLPDLVKLTNDVLSARGYPTYTTDQIRRFVGNGGHALMRQAVPATESEERVLSALNEWKHRYALEGTKLTQPFPGIAETLLELKDKGALLGVLSNKFDAGAVQVVREKLPHVFDLVKGESPACQRKPNPACLLNMIEQLELLPEEVVYLGDSGGDMLTATMAGTYAVGVSWGYQPIEALWEKGAQEVIDEPGQILDIVLAR